MTWRASAQMRSARIGLRLYGIADEPICSFSKGSSTSLRCASRRRSCPIFDREGGHSGQRRLYLVVDLPRVGLPAHGIVPGEPHLLTHRTVERLYLLVVPLEELEERCLGPGGSADTPKAHALDPVVQLLEIEEQILDPERGALADGCRLSRLEVGVAERREVGVRASELGHLLHAPNHACADEPQSLPVENQVRVVADVGARRAEVDDPLCGRGRRPPKRWTCAMTSCRKRRSYSAARSRSRSSSAFRI